MHSRTRTEGRVIILSEPIYRRVRATAFTLGTTPDQIVIAGCRLLCTYVLCEIAPQRSTKTNTERPFPKWELQEIIKVLASRFGSRRTK